MLMDSYKPLTSLKGIGEKNAALFHKLHVETTDDLIHFYPRDYDKLEETSSVSSLVEGQRFVVKLSIVKPAQEKKSGRLTITTFYGADDTGMLQLTFFNMPFIKNTLKKGSSFYFRGKCHLHGTQMIMEQPLVFSASEYYRLQNSLQPIYPLTTGLSQNLIRKTQKQALSEAILTEYMPVSILVENGLCGYEKALHDIHFPNTIEDYYAARKRLVFDEFLLFLLKIRELKDSSTNIRNSFPMIDVADTHRFLEALPFSLTQGQAQAWEEIKNDLTGPYCMNRLIQGDVGCGKTMLALLALIMCAANGHQGAMMAPTEVLATQHYQTFMQYIEKYNLPLRVVLLTGSLTSKQKREAYQQIESGSCNVVLGTHALIQDKVIFSDLGLIITDEQHRFGVSQRETFISKGDESLRKRPHVMVMSATPIPRTLAMILYGDLHISVIKELPANRIPIKNCVVGPSYRPTAYRFFEKEISAGRQIFLICPMIEPSEESTLENVIEYTEKLRNNMPSSIQIGTLHGKMKPSEKQHIMDLFADGKIDILVSTTVIEVGVNVPNATVMMIENAERFGLAQLHQLRGRVGRGNYQSYCIFMDTVSSDKSKARLEVLNHSNDGFAIAEEDLKLRGPGDIFGIRQSGSLYFSLGDIYADSEVLFLADKTANSILDEENWRTKECYQSLIDYLTRFQGNDVDFPSI